MELRNLPTDSWLKIALILISHKHSLFGINYILYLALFLRNVITVCSKMTALYMVLSAIVIYFAKRSWAHNPKFYYKCAQIMTGALHVSPIVTGNDFAKCFAWWTTCFCSSFFSMIKPGHKCMSWQQICHGICKIMNWSHYFVHVNATPIHARFKLKVH